MPIRILLLAWAFAGSVASAAFAQATNYTSVERRSLKRLDFIRST